MKVLIFTVLSFLCQVTFAELPLFVVEPGRNRAFATELRGFSFEVFHDLTVTGLAKFDGNANGLLDDVLAPQVGIWNTSTSELLASATLDEAAVLRDNMFVKPISPIVLPAGNYTVAAQIFRNEEPYIFNTDYTVPSAMLRDVSAVQVRSSEFAMPRQSSSIEGFAPNFIFEQPLVTLAHPSTDAVFQRRNDNSGSIRIEGGFDSARLDSIEVRVVPMDGNLAGASPWQTASLDGTRFHSQIDLTNSGWFEVEARGVKESQVIGEVSVPRVGLGEVFVIAGQSNSANSGQIRLIPSDERVTTMDDRGRWRHAADPQPGADDDGGSPWPVFGDLLTDRIDVPVGIVAVGVGGTSVANWVPGARNPVGDPHYDRLRNVLQILGPDGARAVLWHQGEADAFAQTTPQEYAESLTTIIEQSRVDVGFDMPWGVAQAAFTPDTLLSAEQDVIAGQLQVIDADPLVFAGPLTDDLIGPDWRYDGLHFNAAGLHIHAERWFDAVLRQIVPEPTSNTPIILLSVIGLFFRRRRARYKIALSTSSNLMGPI